ncbi:sensor domain-containing diguanylate cyclase [Variovorax ginsengisoli]|uniref:diguanylate cyclase n=1 Tax=Variovorax ginsengisoli TaxID=363844 RepID=A0ABT9SEA7_9BURK|nr:diguanylate cyclase [Variovorax ginsengisoli]MDP9902684.1 diguanylate cyclase [Variovorax ginsengisoli]
MSLHPFALLMLFVGWWLCAGQEADAAEPRPVYVGANENRPVAAQSQRLEDPAGTLTVDQVRADPRWVDDDRATLNLGASHSVWWLRLRLVSTSAQAEELVLDTGSPLQDYVDFHVLDVAGHERLMRRGGDRLPFSDRQLQTPSVAFRFVLSPGDTVDLYLRLRSHDGVFEAMPLHLASAMQHAVSSATSMLWQGLYFGGLLALAAYNFIVFVLTRRAAFGVYVAYLMAFLLWSFTLKGLSAQYLWPNSPQLVNQMLVIGGSLSFALSGVFAISYMQLAHRLSRRTYALVRGLTVLSLLPIPIGLADHYALAWLVCVPVGLSGVLVTMTTSAWLAWQGVREARVFLLAFALLSVGVLINSLELYPVLYAVLPSSAIVSDFWQIGSVVQMLLLALGLADTMNQMRAAKLAAEQEVNRAQARQALELERQVRARTLELQRANDLLQRLSVTDELTGAFNRRHFNVLCRKALDRAQQGVPVAICMFDVDYFKAYNDIYGHQAGDQVLQAVSAAVQAELQLSGDRLCRLGGEEFGALLTVDTADAAERLAVRLRDAVRRLAIPHNGSPLGKLRASFGMVFWEPEAAMELDPDRMYAAVDQLLYNAKQSGRDRVAVSAIVRQGPDAEAV